MRRANGSGSIFRIKGGGRRRPWRVRVTLGWEVDEATGGARQVVRTVGYYETRREAEKALNEYLDDPYNIEGRDMTFEELYGKWSEGYLASLTGKSSARSVESAYRYMHSLYKVKVRGIRVRHLEDCIRDAYVIPDRGSEKGRKRMTTANTKGRMKSVFNLMFDYAVRYDIVKTNYARNFELSRKDVEQRRRERRKVAIFSNEELVLLWGNVEKIKFADMVLIGIYSGWRPQELAVLKVEDVDLDGGTFFGGLKTDAGRNRCVPIHPLVRDLVAARYAEAVGMGSGYLFNDAEGQQGTYMTYDKYRSRFVKVMARLGMEHHPHETRHTFSTLAKSYGMRDNVRKLILGHAITDFTDRVYTHPMLEELQAEMNKVGKLYPYGVVPDVDADD